MSGLRWTRHGARCTLSRMTIDVRKILVPIDFSDNALAVIEWAAHLAEEHGSKLVLLHAYHLPELAFGESKVKAAGDDLWRLEITVVNDRAIPSVTEWARQSKIHRVDLATVEGARVVASGLVDNTWLDRVELQDDRPERLMVPGVDGLASRTLFFLLEGKGEVTVRYDSLKGGKLSRKVALR